MISSALAGLLAIVPYTACNAQGQPPVRNLAVDYASEPGSPVEVTSSRIELEMDAFGAPLAARVYLDYKNVSDRPVVGVKFRLRFIDQEGKDRGTMHAPDMAILQPGGQSSQKWRTERVDPRTSEAKLRVLTAKFSDGSVWESSKIREQLIITSPGGPGSAAPVEQRAAPVSPATGGTGTP